MTKERLREALISIAIGLIISILSTAIELLKEVDTGTAGNAISSLAGMIAYHLQRLKNYS